MQFLWKYIDDLVGKGLEFNVIVELMLYASVSLVPMALPLAILLSSIMTFGNMGEHYELMAIKSSGINLFRIMMPLIILITFVAFGAFFFSNNVMPYTNLKMGSLLYDVRKQRPEVSIKEGVFNDLLEDYVIKVARKNKNTSMLYDIMIYDHTDKEGNRKVTISDSATMEVTTNNKYMILTMYHGQSYDELIEKNKRRKQKEYPHQITSFNKQRILIDMSGLGFERSDEKLFKNHYQMLNLDQLEYAIDSLENKFLGRELTFVNNLKKNNYFKRLSLATDGSNWYEKDTVVMERMNVDSLFMSLTAARQRSVFEHAKNYVRSTQSFIGSTSSEFNGKMKWIKRHEIEWHRKFTLSFACILLFFIGAPLGAIIRKGGLGMPVVVSVFFFVIYYVITMSGEKSAKIGEWDAWLGMWISAIILFPLGIFLTYKAATDSVILDIETYLKPFKRLFVLHKKVMSAIEKSRGENPFEELSSNEEANETTES
jgi:lipopolysaccharide export system permease protein